MTEITQATEVSSVSENIQALQILEYTDHELFDINKHCSMITKNKCSHSFSDNEDLIMCGSCESKFCYSCKRKGYLSKKYSFKIDDVIQIGEYSECPMCKKVSLLIDWNRELTLEIPQNQCIGNQCIVS